MILLKNEDQVLPLQAESGCKVAVIGANAAAIHSNGGGSAEIKALYEISPLMGIKKLLGGNVKVSYAPGYVIPDKKRHLRSTGRRRARRLQRIPKRKAL
mgnify:CR=1 FL=1